MFHLIIRHTANPLLIYVISFTETSINDSSVNEPNFRIFFAFLCHKFTVVIFKIAKYEETDLENGY
jgi:hypothetical protein